jgi:hypothetical protein
VFLASELTTNDIYAIKAILGQLLQQKSERERILSERDIALEANSPSIVKLVCSMSGTHNFCLVIEFVRDSDLFSLLENVGALAEEQANQFGPMGRGCALGEGQTDSIRTSPLIVSALTLEVQQKIIGSLLDYQDARMEGVGIESTLLACICFYEHIQASSRLIMN